MATINLGAIKFNWKGAYNSGTTDAVDDVVSSGGNSYVCIQAHSNQAVGDATAYWNIMSSAGTNGSNGSNGSDGTDLSTTLTTQGDILYRDGSGLQRLAKGTANQELRINSGATAPERHTPAVASSDYVKLSVTALSQVTYNDFYYMINFSNYRQYKILIQNTKMHSSSDILKYQMLNGSTVKASNYDWNFHSLETMYNSSHQNNKYYGLNDSFIKLHQVTQTTNGAEDSGNFELTIYNNGTSPHGSGSMVWNGAVYSANAGSFQHIRGGAFNDGLGATAHN